MKETKKITAFTLAETLITLMVIGVIAAMTVPTIKQHSDEVRYVSAARKAYSTISNATSAAEVKHIDSYFWDFTSAKTQKWYSEVLNSIPNPVPSKASWEMYSVDGSSPAGTFTPNMWLADGMALQFTSPSNGNSKGGDILVDTNGSQEPNVIGIDIHGFIVGHKSGKAAAFGVYAMGDGCNDVNTTYACTSYAIREGAMPWFKEVGKYTSCAPFVAPSDNCPDFESSGS